VAVKAGEVVSVTIMARHEDNVIGWVVELPASGKKLTHTTFNGLFLDRESLSRTQPDRPASLNQRGRARQIILSYCDGKRSIAEVEDQVLRDHPDLFPSTRASLSFIRHVVAWDTGE
jgi:hypothetical protein